MTDKATSGAADLLDLIEAYAEARHRQGHSSYNAQTAAALQAVKAALAAGQATAAQQGVAYAELPTSSYAGRVYEEGFLIGTCPLYTADQMRAFADATHTLRASHGQAPAGAAEEIDKSLNVYAQAFAARVNGWTRQNGDDLPGARSALFAAIHAYAQASTRPATSPQADSVQEDAARLKEVVGLLEELAEHDNYHAEYDGRMIAICPECGEQEGEHRPSCAFVRAKAYLAARAAQKQGEKQ